ncbi:hypothetical protein HDU83_008242 [Entophlyctis luteolus]|nr:hypothetical protein HDU83_008242 [Entophlyctis luteolus]KAJ3377200.1 hypothetical protein HDU84_008891 [Entophlyctis sp. JEL0112]
MSTNLGLLLIAAAACTAAAVTYPTPSPLHNSAGAVAPPARIARTKVCAVAALGNNQDDGPQIQAAARNCSGGTVVLDGNYFIASYTDLTGLSSVDFDISGTIQFYNDVDYWQSNAFKIVYQNSSAMWRFGGVDINVYGGGTIDGNGQTFYEAYAKNIYIYRPILFVVDGLNGGSISNLTFLRSPQWNNLIANSTNVIYDNLNIVTVSNSSTVAKNTDGWDVYRSDNIVIQNSVIRNGDDCVSFKPNSTNIVVQNLNCTGSHGISVGSLGQYAGEFDIVENIYVFNIHMTNASDGARIKVWPNVASTLNELAGGGGTGRVNNVTFDTFYNTNNDYAIELTQCYGQSNLTLCNMYPSLLTISNVWFQNFYGTSSGKYNDIVGSLVCSSPSVCSNIYARNVSIAANPGFSTADYTCTNIDTTLLQINCLQNTTTTSTTTSGPVASTNLSNASANFVPNVFLTFLFVFASLLRFDEAQ